MIETHTNKGTEDGELIPVQPPPNLPKYADATPQTYSPEADLLVSRAIRGAVTHEIVRNKIPTDPKEVEMLLKVLKDQDSQALGIIRAKIEKDANDLSGENAAIVREMIAGMRGSKPEDMAYTRVGEVPTLPEFPDNLETREFVPGEMDTGATNLTIEDFQKRVGGDIKFAESDKEDE